MASELIKEIRENAEVRDEVRRLILTDELLKTPETVADIQKTQRTMVETLSAVQKTQSTMANLLEKVESRLGQVDSRLGQVDSRLGQVENDAGEVKGSIVENRAERRMLHLAPSQYGLHSPLVVAGEVTAHGPTQQFLDACLKAGATKEQVARLNNTDLIIRARRGEDGASTPVYVVVEAAYILNLEDVNRVGASVEILRGLVPKSTERDAAVVGALYGVSITDEAKSLAERQSIEVFDEPLPR